MRIQVRSGQHPVRRNILIDEGSDPQRRNFPREVHRILLRNIHPSPGGHLSILGVDAHRDLIPEPIHHLRNEFRRFQGAGPKHHPAYPQLQHPFDILAASDSPARLQKKAETRQLFEYPLIFPQAAKCPVEVHDMQERGPRLPEFSGRFQRVVEIDRLPVFPSLAQAYHPAAFQINRRKYSKFRGGVGSLGCSFHLPIPRNATTRIAMAKKAPAKKSARKQKNPAPEFLVDLLNSRSPTGHEFEAQAVIDRYLEPVADDYRKDAMGNRIATLNPKGDPCFMMAGHIDELGLIISYVDDRGYIYFETLGGHDRSMISGRRVVILTRKGPVKGVTGKRAIHLMAPEDRKKVPETHEIWIDIGAKTKEEALQRVAIGDPAVYDQSFELIHGSVGVARAFDDRAGAYLVCEVLRRLAKRKKCHARVVSVATTQEEIGTRGATTSSFAVDPQVAIAVDVGHATDHPDADPRKYGYFEQGKGPILTRGPNVNPLLFQRLLDLAEANKIPYQVEADSRPTGTDARAIQMARGGVATGVLSIPLRYMHTPSELVDLEDIENGVKLLVAFAESLKKGENFHF